MRHTPREPVADCQPAECELSEDERWAAWGNNELPYTFDWTCPHGTKFSVTVDKDTTYYGTPKEQP